MGNYHKKTSKNKENLNNSSNENNVQNENNKEKNNVKDLVPQENEKIFKYHKLLDYKTKKIINISLLNDGRISCCHRYCLVIYNDKYQQYKIPFDNKCCNQLILKNDLILLGFYDIILILKQKEPYETFQEVKVDGKAVSFLEFQHSKFIVGILNKTIKIVLYQLNMKTNKYESHEEIKDINLGNTGISLYLINDKKFLGAFCEAEILNFYNIQNGKINLITSLKNISCSYGRQICCLINNNILIVGGIEQKGFYLIDIKKSIIIGIINDFNINRVHSIIKLKNGNILAGVADKEWRSNLYELKFEKNKLIKIKELEYYYNEGEIYGLCELKDNKICYGAYYGNVIILK